MNEEQPQPEAEHPPPAEPSQPPPEEPYPPVQQEGVVLETEDVHKWEMDTNPYLDRWFHEILGQSEQGGVWAKDDELTPMINKKGAHILSLLIYSRGNIHTQMSEFTMEDIKFMAADAGEDTADLLRDNWREWEISPSKSVMTAIANMVFHIVYSFLLIALKGGMRKHREKRGIKTIVNQPKPMEEVI